MFTQDLVESANACLYLHTVLGPPIKQNQYTNRLKMKLIKIRTLGW